MDTERHRGRGVKDKEREMSRKDREKRERGMWIEKI